ncbi:MAG: hypothetical protein WAS51_17110 [Ilumatobacteraceae bacterium]
MRAAPEYERLLDLVRRREIDVIVAYHPDRAAAEHESTRIGERVSAKHHQNAERGNAHGGAAPTANGEWHRAGSRSCRRKRT